MEWNRIFYVIDQNLKLLFICNVNLLLEGLRQSSKKELQQRLNFTNFSTIQISVFTNIVMIITSTISAQMLQTTEATPSGTDSILYNNAGVAWAHLKRYVHAAQMPIVMPQCPGWQVAIPHIKLWLWQCVLSCNTMKGLSFFTDIWPSDCDQHPHPPYESSSFSKMSAWKRHVSSAKNAKRDNSDAVIFLSEKNKKWLMHYQELMMYSLSYMYSIGKF